MLKTYKYRLKPDDSQKIQINKTFGCCRFVYNNILAYKKDKYENEKISLTAQYLLDYGLVSQLVFSYPDQSDLFGRKLASCVLNTFISKNNYVDLHIVSKAPEWDLSGLLPAQHAIYIKGKSKCPLLQIQDPWPCEVFTTAEQLKHWRCYIIGEDLDRKSTRLNSSH